MHYFKNETKNIWFKLKNILKNMDKNILIVSSAGVSG